MSQQVTRQEFEKALGELGHDPAIYKGKKLSFKSMCDLYKLDEDTVLNAIEKRQISAHYDYLADIIWVDALEAAHFYYCLKSQSSIFAA